MRDTFTEVSLILFSLELLYSNLSLTFFDYLSFYFTTISHNVLDTAHKSVAYEFRYSAKNLLLSTCEYGVPPYCV